MKKNLILILILFSLGITCKASGENRLPILLYHNVTYDEPVKNLDLHISLKQFENHMKYLKDAGFNTISFEQYYNYRTKGDTIPENPIIITFDDGYLTNYSYAYPILKKYGFCATFFMVTESSYRPYISIFPHYNWKQAAEMEQSGIIDIESHSALHEIHGMLSSSDIIYNIRKSYYDIYKNLGKKPTVYSYPTGSCTNESKKIAKETGFTMQVLVSGLINTDNTPLDSLTRLNISGSYTAYDLENLINNSCTN